MPPKDNDPMVRRIPVTQARVNLGSVIKKIHLEKEYVILEKDGIPIAGIMDIDEFEDYLELRDKKVQAQIKKSREDYQAGRSRKAKEFLNEIRGKAPKRNRRPAKV